jgi:hypothetical protein
MGTQASLAQCRLQKGATVGVVLEEGALCCEWVDLERKLSLAFLHFLNGANF